MSVGMQDVVFDANRACTPGLFSTDGGDIE